MPAVVFDPEEFREINPQFADIPDRQLYFAFDVACVVVDNSGRSKVPYNPPKVTTRRTILYLLVCHLCELKLRGNVVGNVVSATEGSVSASFAAPTSPNAGWYNQTQCGATAWKLLSGYAVGGRLYTGKHPGRRQCP
ncbi:MAG: DUF4054 domain-containing protein [Desulfovibrio sp.]|jgi:hypothetical protein|nr:DUF4054 domain-containing protein [Desulfovibrio sp.]